MIDRDAQFLQSQVFCVAVAAESIEDRIGCQDLATLEFDLDLAVFGDDRRRVFLSVGEAFVHAQFDAVAAHAAGEFLPDLTVKQSIHWPPFGMDQRGLDAQSVEETGVFRSDDTAADHHHRFGKLLHFEHGGGIENVVLVELNIFGPRRSRAGGDENDPSADFFHGAVGTGDLYRVGIDDASDAGHAGDVVPGGGEVAGGALLFAALDEVLAVHEAVQRDVGFELYVQAFAELASAEAREKQGRFAQGFAGESAPVDAGAAQLAIGFDEDGLVTEIGRLRGTLFACGSAADDNQFIVIIRHEIVPSLSHCIFSHASLGSHDNAAGHIRMH